MLRPWNLKLNIELDKKSGPKYQQLACEIQRQIEDGTLKPGDALPGSREFAQQLGVSRKTVVTAMNSLVTDGWLENRDRVGLFVSESHSLVEPAAAKSLGVVKLQVTDGFPDSLLLPLADMGRIFRQVFVRAARWKMMGYYDPRGNKMFCQQIADAMSHERGVGVTRDQLMLTRGGQQALYLIAHAILKPGQTVIVESMAYEGVRAAFESAGLELVYVPVDDEGMRMDALKRMLEQYPEVHAVYVTPRFHYPTTVTMTNPRRHQLAELSEQYGFMVIEDDFDCHFYFSNQRHLSLCSMIPPERYFYVSTFSKVMAPALRMAVVCSSELHVTKLMEYRRLVDMQGEAVMEHTMLQLMESGAMRRHLHQVRRIYRERLDYTCQQIKLHLHDVVKFKRPSGGLALWLVMDRDPRPRLQSHGIEAPIFELPDNRFGLRVGYAAMTHENVDYLVAALKEV